jgi:hypothetical protein
MYVDMESVKARDAKRRWLWKVQFEREARGKIILSFAFGFGIGFACCTVLYTMLERVS